ncbi:ABC transporter permease [Alkalicoccus daliensis]|uniref:Putative spermidine/putrescine transport system permease protein n=1 Tax=Alkalicoccus daliensis TaxID=745820 RepID=A0A1H0K916_9BACI|nr:ABC transporter permease subunit [Alkalicoccus daliensis]SDO52282.1 putative spermidine/putrescine transport system permease protein [Alkalicoccus daliensis]
MFSSARSFLLLAPLLLFMILFVGQGLYRAFSESLHAGDNFLENYEQLFTQGTFWSSLQISVYVAFVSTLLSLIIGLWITRTLFRLFRTDQWKLAAWFPMLIPHFVAAYIIVLFFSPSGWFSAVLESLPLAGTFPVLVNDPLYLGVIITYIWKEVPFVVLMLLPVYQEIDWRMEEVGRSLGAKGFTLFRTVEWPWAGPVTAEVFLILFVFILGAFEVPALLGVTYPAMVPVLAFEWFYQGGWSNRPLAQAMMIVLTFFSVLLSFCLLYAVQRSRRKWMKGGKSNA